MKYDTEHMTKAVGLNLPISTKMSVEICNVLRGMPVAKAKQLLEKVIQLQEPIPIRRFRRELAHKRKIGPGRFPVVASKHLLQLLESVESNAQFKGLNTSELMINHLCVHKAATSWHYGRQRRRKMKRSHVEIIVKEQPKSETKPQDAQKKKKQGK